MRFRSLLAMILICLAASVRLSAQEVDWPKVTSTARPGVIWWWPGSAVDADNLTGELESLHAAGFGGANIVPIYGVKGAEDRFLEYRSPEWLRMIDHTVREAQRLGMWIDMTTGTGWRFGGPEVTPAETSQDAKWENDSLVVSPRRDSVKRAAPGGKGLTLNPFSQAPLQAFLDRIDGGFAQESVQWPRAQYHDSFEYQGNWSPELFEQFQARRGYDLQEHIAELFGDENEAFDQAVVARVKCDYRRTMAEMHLDWIRTWDKWAEGHGMQTRNQAHGAPGNLLDLYAAADVAEIETFGAAEVPVPGIRFEHQWMRDDHVQPFIQRLASSAAHLAGHQLVSAETGTWLRNHFHVSLAMLKPELDELFLNGVNHLLYHGTCYSPDDARWPGWLFYAAWECNDRNSIWYDVPSMNAYVTRVQSVLQAGSPDQDVLLYWPVFDLWQNPRGMLMPLTVHKTGWYDDAPAATTAARLGEIGVTLDWVSDDLLQQLSDEAAFSYKAIVIPPTRVMPLATAQALAKLRSAGIPVVFVGGKPTEVPGLKDFERLQLELAETLSPMTQVDELSLEALPAQVQESAVVDLAANGLRFIRRKMDTGYAYYISNLTGDGTQAWCTLPHTGTAVWMDPLDGRRGLATTRETDHPNATTVLVALEPGQSRILWLDSSGRGCDSSWPDWVTAKGDAVAIDGTWDVRFLTGGPTLPQDVAMETVKPWSALGGEYENFSGTAIYSTKFHVSQADSLTAWRLDLGDVRESARVRINGQDLGVVWSAPFALDVVGVLKPGENTLELEVTSLAANRIRDLDRRGVEWRIFYDINFVTHLYEKFDASDWPVEPSGLVGPVRFLPLQNAPEAESTGL